VLDAIHIKLDLYLYCLFIYMTVVMVLIYSNQPTKSDHIVTLTYKYINTKE